MITKTTKTDKYGNVIIDYRVTKGDTFVQNITIKRNEEVMPPELISRVEFVLGDYDYNEVDELRKEYTYNPLTSKYTVILTHEDMLKLIENETYRYQIVITYSVGKTYTLTSGKMTITDLIEEE